MIKTSNFDYQQQLVFLKIIVWDIHEHIVVLEEGKIVKDIKTSQATLKELESYFAGEQIEEGEFFVVKRMFAGW